MTPSLLLAIGAAGALGALVRHLLVLALRDVVAGFPLGIVLVNVVGCFGFGVCWALAEGRWSPVVASAVLVGFFGAFTTFSSFAADCHTLWAAGRTWTWLANVLAQNVGGLVAMAAGIRLGQLLGRA